MREETQPSETICALCKRPIEPGQRPAITLRDGGQAHIFCYSRRDIPATSENPTTVPEAAMPPEVGREIPSATNGVPCRICGVLPAPGTLFENNLCDDCQLSLRNYGTTP